jgi:hypothetical protein
MPAAKKKSASPRKPPPTLAAVRDEAIRRNQPIVLKRGRKAVAAVVPIAHVRAARRALEALEDQMDGAAAKAALDAYRKSGLPPLSLDELLKDLGMTRADLDA